MQQRGDIAVGRVQLRVTNDSATATTLTAASFTSPVLAGPAEWNAVRPTTLAPGRTVDLPVLLPAIRCTDDAQAPEATFTADGVTATAPLADELDVLPRASATACDRDDLASVVQVRATSAAAGPDGSILMRVAVEPVPEGRGTADLVALRGTVLLRFAAGAEAPVGLSVAAGDAPSVVEIAVVPQRCDAHAIAEDKVGTLFDLVARVDGREVVVPLERSKDVADALLALTAEVCGLAPAL